MGTAWGCDSYEVAAWWALAKTSTVPEPSVLTATTWSEPGLADGVLTRRPMGP